jgi:hypothetical protein
MEALAAGTDLSMISLVQTVVRRSDASRSSRTGDSAPRSVTRHLWPGVASRGHGLIKSVVQNCGFELAAAKEGLPVLAFWTTAVEEEGFSRCFVHPVPLMSAILLVVHTVQVSTVSHLRQIE